MSCILLVRTVSVRSTYYRDVAVLPEPCVELYSQVQYVLKTIFTGLWALFSVTALHIMHLNEGKPHEGLGNSPDCK